jgi:hypothetical protein
MKYMIMIASILVLTACSGMRQADRSSGASSAGYGGASSGAGAGSGTDSMYRTIDSRYAMPGDPYFGG